MHELKHLLVALHWCCSDDTCTGPHKCKQVDEHAHSAAGNKNGLLLPNTATDQGTADEPQNASIMLYLQMAAAITALNAPFLTSVFLAHS